MTPLLLLPALLTGCLGGGSTFSGTRMADYFPMDGAEAVYVSDDASVEYKLELSKVDGTETIGERQVTTFEQYRDDTSSLLGGVKWSVVSGDPVQIHGWAGPDGQYVMYDPPIDVTSTSGTMKTGEEVVTETGGTTFTSTYVENVAECPVLWGPDWENCIHIRIDDGDGDDDAGPIFAGDYWLVTRYWIAWMQPTGATDKWNLQNFTAEGE